MKNMISSIILYLVILLLCGCSSSKYTISRFGDKALLLFNNGLEIECEIISISDSSIIFSLLPEHHYDYTLLPQTIYDVNINEIKSISIEGFDGKGWGTSVIITQLIPVGLLVVAALSAEMDIGPVLTVFSPPAILTSVLFVASEGETPSWNKSDSSKTINELNIYSRFPMGLSSNEIANLLKNSNQTKLNKFKNNQ
jgi:hypothetical protein